MADTYFKIKKGISVEPGALSGSEKGDVTADTSTGKLKYHNGTTESPVVTEGHTATLTNKTLTSPTITTPTLSGSGGPLTLPAGPDTLVGRATSDTLTNKTLTSPVINTPTGIVKGDVGLGNVDNTSDVTKNAASVTLTNKTISGASNTITNVSLTTGVTGTLPLGNGGTGQITANAALNALLPSQVSANGKILGSNGTDTSWVAAGGTGTVTSVTFTGDNIIHSSTPSAAVTTTGTLTPTLKTQTAGTFLAGPTSGSAATPTFRALQAPTIQKFLSGSGTYTLPAGALYIRVRMVGGGGGGANGGTSGGTAGTAGTASTFGTSLLSAGGGGVGSWSYTPGAGGTSSLGTGPIGIALSGGYGNSSIGGGGAGAQNISGSNGGVSALGGSGRGGTPDGTSPTAGTTNTGAGGGGGYGGSSANTTGGAGGGAGGFVDAIITSPAATYAYVVGAAGTGQAVGGGTGAQAGAAGSAGLIEVTEYYQ